MVVLHRHPRIVVWHDADLSQGGRESSVRADTNLLRIWVEKAETRRRTSCATMLKDRGRHRKDRLNYHCRNRAPFDLPSVRFTMIFSVASLGLSTG